MRYYFKRYNLGSVVNPHGTVFKISFAKFLSWVIFINECNISGGKIFHV